MVMLSYRGISRVLLRDYLPGTSQYSSTSVKELSRAWASAKCAPVSYNT